MASLLGPDDATSWECEMPRCGNTLTPDDDETECEICSKTICDGCSYECITCGGWVCIDHKIGCPAEEFGAIYECTVCFGKRVEAALARVAAARVR